MKITTILLIVSIMQVSASTFAQKVTINQRNVSLEQVFKQVRAQSGYDILYDVDLLKNKPKINLNIRELPVESAMQAVLKDQGLAFDIKGKTIVITGQDPSMFASIKEKVKSFFVTDSVVFKGMVVDEKGLPMPGATVRIQGTNRVVKSNADGGFRVYTSRKGGLEISFVGYANRVITLSGLDPDQVISVTMSLGQSDLNEVQVVSTGYQDIPKERATGSFEVITAKQLQHSNDPDLIRRLEGITTSMDFRNQLTPTNSARGNARPSALGNLTIRGKNTLSAFSNSGQVLVVIDGIASPYPIENVNPNDVESMTILKDAAAASIWGSRAANGVIVVKTKKGSFEQPTTISFNSNFNITEKMDLFYKKKMSVSDFIDVQQQIYNRDYPDPDAFLGDPTFEFYQRPISPVFEIMNAWKKSQGGISIPERDAQLDALRGNDIRRDYTKYVARNELKHNHSLSLQGGSQKVAYRVSANYDKALNNTINSGSDRLTLNYGMTLRPLKRLELETQVSYALNHSNSQGENKIDFEDTELFFPYQRLVDDQGNPVSVARNYRPIFLDILEEKYGNSLQNMRYVPLQDINEGSSTARDQNLNFNVMARYKVSEILSANLQYSYNKGLLSNIQLQTRNSYFMRRQFNYYTDPATLKSALDYGDKYNPSNINSTNHTVRGQLNLNKKWGEHHELSAIAGMDVSQSYSFNSGDTYYGYSHETLRYQQVYPFPEVPILFREVEFQSPTASLPFTGMAFNDSRTRTISSFANAAYTYMGRYTLSGSIRKDGSSAFGEGNNRTGTPFYSAGLSWNIDKEPFYQFEFLPRLQFRATFGYNGNVNSQVGPNAYLYDSGTRNDFPGNLPVSTTLPFQVSNRLLRPEKTAHFNLGLDFGFRGNRITGSLEYYDKRTSDLISPTNVDPTKGFLNLTFNVADMHGWGTDFTLNSINIRTPRFGWNSSFLFSYNRVKVTDIFIAKPETALQYVDGIPRYNKGYDLSRLFAFRWKGLDPETGDPRGYLNDQVVTINNTGTGSKNFSDILNSSGTSSSVRYMGSAVPVYHGSLRNTFSYENFSISLNLLYKLGYYFRRPEVDLALYNTLYEYPGRLVGAEFGNRWQKPGDEQRTNVPSLVQNSRNRDFFYKYADINVQKGDHVRLQEINLSYAFPNKNILFLKSPRAYVNIPTGDVIIWRANKLGLDPDINDYPRPKVYGFGFSASF